MGEILTKIKRNYKTHQIKKEKSESLSEKKLKEIMGNQLKELEKEIKTYETKWKKTNKNNNDFKKELTSFESYYKNLKYTFLACQKNIDKTANKIDKMIDILNKQSQKLGKAKNTEKNLDDFNKIGELQPEIENQQQTIKTIINSLEEIRTKQKKLIDKNPGALIISPEYLKNKLKAIKKALPTTSVRINDKTQKLDKLIKSIKDIQPVESGRISYLDGKKYYLEKFMPFAKTKKVQNNLNEESIKKDAENFFKNNLPNTLNNNDHAYFSLGVINSFYADLYKSSKKLYQETQKMRQEADKTTDGLLRKNLKIAAILIPGLIGMVASVMGACSGDLVLFISALGFVASQLGYSVQEALDGVNSSMSDNEKERISNVNMLLNELGQNN